jgi:signal peptidase II
MRKYVRTLCIILIVFLFVGCDQATKSFAVRNLPFSHSLTYCGGFVRLQLAENPGYFLSIGSSLPRIIRTTFAILMAILSLIGFMALLRFAKKLTMLSLVAFALLCAGSFGNLIDRLFNHGSVIDFLILGTAALHTGILNIADLLITTSLIMLFIIEVVHKRFT